MYANRVGTTPAVPMGPCVAIFEASGGKQMKIFQRYVVLDRIAGIQTRGPIDVDPKVGLSSIATLRFGTSPKPRYSSIRGALKCPNKCHEGLSINVQAVSALTVLLSAASIDA